ncbi:MAG TPA: HAD family phosphatase [Opitutales bacterium]|nr:HAD family phosphatase [Opitutales bacterium]
MAFENLHIDFPEKPYAGYIFDCDGTIADSMLLHHRAWQYALKSHGATFDYTWEIFTSLAGVGHEDTVRKINVRYNQDLDPVAVTRAKEEWYAGHVEEVGPITPMTDYVRRLAEEGAKMAVASGGPRVLVMRTLRAIRLEGAFKAVVTQDDISRSKPDPEIFLKAAYQLGVDPHQCVVFEDSHLGIAGAKSAGMDYVLIPQVH